MVPYSFYSLVIDKYHNNKGKIVKFNLLSIQSQIKSHIFQFNIEHLEFRIQCSTIRG